MNYDYFGEWSSRTNSPHGRGIWFGGNTMRVGYFNNGEIARGKVFKSVLCGDGKIDVSIGTEDYKMGRTKFKGRTHYPDSRCMTGTWIDNKR